jgi:hypothetical protein
MPRLASSSLIILFLLLMLPSWAWGEPPRPPAGMTARDRPWDNGSYVEVFIELSPDDEPADDPAQGISYLVERSGEFNGLYEEVARVQATDKDRRLGRIRVLADKAVRGETYWVRVAAVGPGPEEERSAYVKTPEEAPVIPTRAFFDASRGWLAVITLVVCSSVIIFILLGRWGMPLKVRAIAGLEAVEEAVGRATEMGRSVLFIPGIQDMNDIQTIAGLTILSGVAEQAAEYDCLLEVPCARSLVMTASRETVETAYLAAGRPDAYQEDNVFYVTDEQFAYVSYLTGKMVREKPAACFYLGAFFAESLILAETGNAVGAIQVAGTAQPAQLPFFVAACDYTLIGEEFFAASAYLSGDPDQLGSLKGQDVGKLIVGALILVGVTLVSLVEVSPENLLLADAAEYLTEVILHAGG